jgi:hypothetical protein
MRGDQIVKPIDLSRMTAKGAARLIVGFALCITVMIILRSCMLFRTVASQARLKLWLASLPEPQEVVLLDETTGVGSGSDERCYTAYVHRLYGSDQTAEDIFTFFQGTLLSSNGWEQIERSSSNRKLTFYNRKDGFRLSIDYNIGSYATRGFTRFSEQSLAEARRQFAMPFVVVVNHADAGTREICWPGWEP